MDELAQALKSYIADFLHQASATDLQLSQVTIAPVLAAAAQRVGVGFKTSFGQGSPAQIPWLACFAPGQSASVEGAYPVLLYRRDRQSLAVAYSVSAMADAATGDWPRAWPAALTSALPHFGDKKYANSFVYKEYADGPATPIDEIVAAFTTLIAEFLALMGTTPLTQGLSPVTLAEFHAQAASAGLSLTPAMPARLLAALATKPFCILTGLAGSGKTKLAEALALWLSASPTQFKLVAVGADWTSNEQLLGYADALHGALYRKPANGVLDLLLAAAANPTQPHFLILDEMNLSHVERYFADMLSALESSRAVLALHSHPDKLASTEGSNPEVPPSLPLPRNLFIIGTVNVDETTYTFSPKVLDRANVIEFRASRDQLDQFLDDPARLDLDELLDDQGRGRGAAYGPALVALLAAEADPATLGDVDRQQLKTALLAAFDLLAEMGAEFGFRSAHEMVRFVVIHKALCGSDWTLAAALDAQVLQKLMPRLHGSARKLDPVLTALHAFCTQHALGDSLEKIARMQKRLRADGFASFAEN